MSRCAPTPQTHRSKTNLNRPIIHLPTPTTPAAQAAAQASAPAAAQATALPPLPAPMTPEAAYTALLAAQRAYLADPAPVPLKVHQNAGKSLVALLGSGESTEAIALRLVTAYSSRGEALDLLERMRQRTTRALLDISVAVRALPDAQAEATGEVTR